MNEQVKNYSGYECDRLDPARKLVIERTIWFESEKADISALSALSALPLAELMRLRQESVAAEQAVFERLQTEAGAWEQQAGNTRFLEKAIEYLQTPPAKHTSNRWETTYHDWQIRSNAVYQMSYCINEYTRYDRQAQESLPYSWSLTWNVRTNSPVDERNVKIAGQEHKTFRDKAVLEKYLAGRIKAYDRLFTETVPSVPKEYAEPFKVNGLLLPGYVIEREPQQAVQPMLPAPEQTEADAPAMQAAPHTALPLTDLQKKAVAIAKKYESLPTQEKIAVIAQAFGCTAGRIETSPCAGEWRGSSDVSIRFDNGASLFLGNCLTPKAKTAAVQRELVSAVLPCYNTEIVSAAKEAALASLMEREAKDNAIAAQKGLKPYTLLNVEFNDSADSQYSGYRGWYYVTLVVDGKILSHIESGLNHDIAEGKVSAEPTREKYFAAGALKDSEVDFVFNNVGFSSTSTLYTLPVSDAVLRRAERTLAERTRGEKGQNNGQNVIYTMHTNPRSESLADRSFLQVYEQKPDGKAVPGEVLFIGTSEKCRELLQSLNDGALTQDEVKTLYAKA